MLERPSCLTSSPALDNLSTMERFVRAARAGLRRLLIDPILGPVFNRFDQIDRRLDRLEGRLDGLQGLLEQMSARTSARTETSLATTEDNARTARRLDEIERILGAR
jgi:hypothetical protein